MRRNSTRLMLVLLVMCVLAPEAVADTVARSAADLKLTSREDTNDAGTQRGSRVNHCHVKANRKSIDLLPSRLVCSIEERVREMQAIIDEAL